MQNQDELTTKVLEGVEETVKQIKPGKLAKNGTGMRINTGIIGCGAGGANIAHLMTQYGYQTAALNTTAADMTGLNIGTKITLAGLNGSGKDRQFAAAEFKRSYKNFFNHEQIQNLIEENDLIVIPATAGGGTGTILSIMVAGYIKNEYPNKLPVIVGMLPSLKKDDKISQENAKEFLSDLDNKASCPYMLFDNNRVTDKVGDAVFDVVNADVVAAIRILSKEFMIENTRGNIDGRDYARLMSFEGLMSIVSIQDLNISVTETDIDMLSRVKNAMSKSTAIFTGHPDAYGFYTNIDSEIYTMMDTSFEEVQNELGAPSAGLVVRQLQDRVANNPQFAMIMMGCDSPIERFKMIERRIEEYTNATEKVKIGSVDRAESVQVSGDLKSTAGKGSSFMDSF